MLMARRVVLFVHGPRNVGGDTTVLLHTLEHLDPTRIDALVAATPDCEAWQRFTELRGRVGFRLLPLDTGVTGTDPGSPRRGRGANALLVARALARLIGLIRRHRVEVVYTLDRSRAVLLASLAAKLARRPLVFHAHYPYYPSARWSEAVVRSAACVVAISAFIRREYEQRGVDPRRIRVIYNGIDADRYASGDRAGARAALGIASAEQLVLLPGRLSRYKGQVELLEAMPTILELVATARCVFAGYDSPELGDLVVPGCGTVGAVLQKRAAELSITGRVVLTGATNRMADLYAAADVVVCPSWAEPFGLVVAEAMAAARPIVGAASGAIPELIEHERSGLLAPPRDPPALASAVVRILHDSALAERLAAEAARAVRERFTIARYAAELQDVLVGVRF
jgi:glycosyltransferase involved in cell wall biosynthesis